MRILAHAPWDSKLLDSDDFDQFGLLRAKILQKTGALQERDLDARGITMTIWIFLGFPYGPASEQLAQLMTIF